MEECPCNVGRYDGRDRHGGRKEKTGLDRVRLGRSVRVRVVRFCTIRHSYVYRVRLGRGPFPANLGLMYERAGMSGVHRRDGARQVGDFRIPSHPERRAAGDVGGGQAEVRGIGRCFRSSKCPCSLGSMTAMCYPRGVMGGPTDPLQIPGWPHELYSSSPLSVLPCGGVQ